MRVHVLLQVVPPQQLTLQELAVFDGSDPAKPMYLAIQVRACRHTHTHVHTCVRTCPPPPSPIWRHLRREGERAV